MRLFFMRHGQSANNAACSDDSITSQESRVPDAPLTSVGRDQVTASSQWLSQFVTSLIAKNRFHDHEPVSLILCSPMTRALETASALSQAFPGVPVVVTKSICEVGGLFVGTRAMTPIPTRSSRIDHNSSSSPPHISSARDTKDSRLSPVPTQATASIVPGLPLAALERQFPCVSATYGIGSDGWWNTGRESHLEATRRVWNVARHLWTMAHANPRGTIIMITHGLFQHLLLQALHESAGCWKTSAISENDLEQSCTPDVGECFKKYLASRGLSVGGNSRITFPQEPPCTSGNYLTSTIMPEDPYNSYQNVHFLSNNGGISLLELITYQEAHVKALNATTDQEKAGACLQLGVLFWNQACFLQAAQYDASGHVVKNFSVF